ncbi:MAG TPA: HAD-IIB family hydrolase [Gemmataceae bacterium]
MSGPGQQVLRWLTDVYESGRPLVLLFDFDGTLVPIAEHALPASPNGAPARNGHAGPLVASGGRLAPGTRQVLADLARQENLFVGVVSSRSLADLKGQVGIPDLYYAGCCGLELDLLGILVTPPQAEAGQELLGELERRLAGAAKDFPGARVERKPLALTVHYGGVEPGRAPAFQSAVREALKPFADRTQVWEMRQAFELIPALGASKATALQQIVEDASRDGLPFYAGDQANDAEALALAAELGGLAVGVGPNAPEAAGCRLDSPRNLVQVFQRFVNAVAARGTRPAAKTGSPAPGGDRDD